MKTQAEIEQRDALLFALDEALGDVGPAMTMDQRMRVKRDLLRIIDGYAHDLSKDRSE